MKKTELHYKRRFSRIINERIGEILDEIKQDFKNNLETIGTGFEQKFEIINELEAIKIRIWSYK